MESLFVPYEIALALKELGFDEPYCGLYCQGNYTVFNIFGDKFNEDDAIDLIKAPLYQQAFTWFRETYKLHNIIDFNSSKNNMWYYSTLNIEYNISETNKESFKTYEEAELECLKKLIEIVKQQHNG